MVGGMDAPEPTSPMSRRRFLRMAGVLAGTTAAAGYSLALERSDLGVPAPPGSPGLRGLRIGFVSDIHRSPIVSRAAVERQAAIFGDAGVDLLVVGGDLVSSPYSQPEQIEEVLGILGEVPAPLGRVVVPGNHDKSMRRKDTLAGAEARGFHDLTNRGLRVEYGGSALWVAGLDDHTQGSPRIESALHGRAGEPVLLVTHNPDAIIRRLRDEDEVWLALAGHLHGGQVRLPFMGALVLPTRYPEHFDHGWASPLGRRTYVTRGSGEVHVPLRLGCPPEVCIFTVV
jgi:uncharacterized protein